MKPAFLLDLLYECSMCKADLRGAPLPVVITIRAGSRDFAFSHRTRMLPNPDGLAPPDHVSCPACGMLFVFDAWSSVITNTAPIDDLTPGGSPDGEIDLLLGLAAAFGNFERFSDRVTEGMHAGGSVPQGPEFARLVTRLRDLHRAGLGRGYPTQGDEPGEAAARPWSGQAPKRPWVEPKAHIDALVTLALLGPTDPAITYFTGWSFVYMAPDETTEHGLRARGSGYGPGEPARMGQVLWDESVRGARVLHGDLGPPEVYVYAPGRRLSVIEALKAINGYQSRACQDNAWWSGEASRLTTCLLRTLLPNVPGYVGSAETWKIAD
jgi:hypothetical protein